MPVAIPPAVKKEIGRLRSEIRKTRKEFKESEKLRKDINPFTSTVSGNYWTQTGMPWASGAGRKAVLTEYFWQPIRGQPRRVDTNELRQFSQGHWVNACVNVLLSEISSLDWDIVPIEGYEYDWVEKGIKRVKGFLENPNKNDESFGDLIRAFLKDILEIDAGVIVKVFDINSYDFDDIEPKSGAPMLKPIGHRRMTELYIRDGASFLKEIDKFGFEKGFWQYSYQIPAHPMWFNRDEIVYIMEHQRSMSCYGFSRIQSVLDVVKSLHYSTLYNKKFFEESSIPDGALSLMDTNKAEMNAFRNYWNNDFKAQPHKVAIINKDLKWQPFALSNKDLDFLDTQKWYFNLVISTFGLSPTELGITEDANRATSATQAELVKRKSIRPLLKIIENAFNHGVLPEFGVEGIEFQFIYDDPAEKKSRLDNWNLELSMGVKTVNEVRNEMGLEPIEGGDVSNSMAARLAEQSSGYDGSEGDGDSGEEERESSNYQETRDREEEDVQSRKKTGSEESLEAVRRPYSDETRLKFAKAKYKKMSFKDLIAEHTRLVEVLESGDEEDIKSEAAKQKKELEEYISEAEKTQKGVDDGQYYREPPLSQRRRASGAEFQPQNPKPRSGMQPARKPGAWSRGTQVDTDPSHLGDSQAKPGVDDFRSNANTIYCPVCGRATLANLNTLESLPEDFRCTNCGSRFRASELLASRVNETISNVLEENNNSDAVTIPEWKVKGARDEGSDDYLVVKDYTGVDIEKAFPYAMTYADSKAYKRLLAKYLSDLSKADRAKVLQVIKTALKVGSTIRDAAKQIEEIVGDKKRAVLIARTEIVRVANEGNIIQAKERGVKKMEWLSAPNDGRLCDACKARNGKVYPIDEVKGDIPLHPSCRCTLLEVQE